MERLTEWVGSGPDRKAIARQDRRDIGDKDCVTRLAAYEDTNLTPEAAAQLKQIAEIFNCDPANQAQLKQLCDKLRGWQQAEQDGRLVVLPCKVGDTVYKVAKTIKFYGNGTRIFVCEVEASLRAIFDWVRYGDFGKTVFLTRREAEAAVRRESDT